MFSFKDVPLEIPFLFFLPSSFKKHKTFKQYLIGIICDRFIDFKYKRKSAVAGALGRRITPLQVSETTV
jgi:hypothetical protein